MANRNFQGELSLSQPLQASYTQRFSHQLEILENSKVWYFETWLLVDEV